MGTGIHLLGPLAGKVLRVSPPLVISAQDAVESLDLMYRILATLAPAESKSAGRRAELSVAVSK